MQAFDALVDTRKHMVALNVNEQSFVHKLVEVRNENIVRSVYIIEDTNINAQCECVLSVGVGNVNDNEGNDVINNA